MFYKNWKKQTRKGMRFVAGMLAAVLTVAAPFESMSETAFGAQWKEDQTLPVGGMIGFSVETVDDFSSGETCGSYTLRSIRPELGQYDWDCYSNDYYYSKLSAEEREFYERLDAVCGELLTSPGLDAQTHTVIGSGAKRTGTELVSGQGLSWEQMKRVVVLFLSSNPQYYFLNTNLMPSKDRSSCALGMYNAFQKGSDRARETKKVRARIEALQAQINDQGIPYDREFRIHELLCDELEYMTREDALSDTTDPYYTQTVYGALMTGETVCAGYAKLYMMLCNYFGIDCIVLTSMAHAWNQVRYGDHWYIVDVTWNDVPDRSKYFHITDQRMQATDRYDYHVAYSYYEGIRPTADVEFFESLKEMPGLTQPQVEITDTARGLTITMSSEKGDIYYTLDGTIPGADDLYTEPIELTDSDTYIVTAMAADEGAISSAYEIFPVRIAGGKVSVASAVNVSGKKIRVQFKTSDDYDGYEISFASKKDFRDQKSRQYERNKISNGRALLIGLKKGKTYYIRVRGYKKDAYGNAYYTPYSKVKKVTVTK